MSSILYLSIRVLHVVLAAVWMGSTLFLGVFLMPVIEQLGDPGGSVMIGLARRKLNAFISAVAGTTVLSGIWLFWRFTAGFTPDLSASHAGLCFSIGGAAGLLALIIGGSVVGRSAQKAVDLAEKMALLPEGQPRAALATQAAGFRQRTQTFGTVVIVLLLIAMAFMAIGHYV